MCVFGQTRRNIFINKIAFDIREAKRKHHTPTCAHTYTSSTRKMNEYKYETRECKFVFPSFAREMVVVVFVVRNVTRPKSVTNRYERTHARSLSRVHRIPIQSHIKIIWTSIVMEI